MPTFVKPRIRPAPSDEIWDIILLAVRALRDAGQLQAEKEMDRRLLRAQSSDEARRIVAEYVEVT